MSILRGLNQAFDWMAIQIGLIGLLMLTAEVFFLVKEAKQKKEMEKTK